MSDNLRQLCSRINVDAPNIAALPTSWLEEQISALRLPPGEEGPLLVEVAMLRRGNGVTSDNHMHQYFKQKEEVEANPWKTSERMALKHVARMQEYCNDSEAISQLRSCFVRAAKNGTLSILEVLVGQYLLFASSTEVGAKNLMFLLLNVPPSERMNVHNWTLAQSIPEPVRFSYGSVIEKLGVPLFPPQNEELEGLNEKLLLAKMEAMTQGKGPSGGEGSLFREEVLFSFKASKKKEDGSEVEGGTTFPVVNTPQGPMVDMQVVERTFDNVFNEIRMLRGALEKLPAQKPKATMEEVLAGLAKRLGGLQRALRGRGGRTGAPYSAPYRRRGARGGEEEGSAADQETNNSLF